MRENENITAITIASNFLIIVGAGHGIIPLGLLEFYWFPYIDSEYFTLVIFSSYDDSIGAACLFSFIGNICLIVSMFLKRLIFNKRAILIGSVFLFVGFFYLVHSVVFREIGALISFFTGLPFIISSIVLLTKLRIQSES